MLDFQQKRKVKSFMYNRITIGILFVVMLLTLRSTWSVYQKQMESQSLKEISEKKFAELELRKKEINDKIQALNTTEGLEREIRSKFNVVKENENMAVILDEANSDNYNATTTKSFWQKVKNFFKW